MQKLTINKVLISIMTLFIFLMGNSALAQIYVKGYELSLFGGYNFFDHGLNLDDTTVFGGRLGYNINKNYGVELSFEKYSSHVYDKNLVGTKGGQYRSPIDKVTLDFTHIDCIYHFNYKGKYNPFVLLGFGQANYKPKADGIKKTVVDLGLGVKYWLDEKTALRADIQWTDKRYETTLSLIYAFGGKKYDEIVGNLLVPAKEMAEKEKESDRDSWKSLLLEAFDAPEEDIMDDDDISGPTAQELTQKEEKEEIKIVLDDIHFEHNSFALTQNAKRVLDNNVRKLRENPQIRVRIVGHASMSGALAYNVKISEQRAKTVEDYLIDQGIRPVRLSRIGYGNSLPIMTEINPRDINSQAAWANRRVSFEILANLY